MCKVYLTNYMTACGKMGPTEQASYLNVSKYMDSPSSIISISMEYPMGRDTFQLQYNTLIIYGPVFPKCLWVNIDIVTYDIKMTS